METVKPATIHEDILLLNAKRRKEKSPFYIKSRKVQDDFTCFLFDVSPDDFFPSKQGNKETSLI